MENFNSYYKDSNINSIVMYKCEKKPKMSLLVAKTFN